MLGQKPWLHDPLVVRKPWSDVEYALADHGGRGAQLCFAVMWHDGHTVPNPPVIRGLEAAKRALLARERAFRALSYNALLVLVSSACRDRYRLTIDRPSV